MLTEILLAIALIAIPLVWAKIFINRSNQRGHNEPAPNNKRNADIAFRQQHVFED